MEEIKVLNFRQLGFIPTQDGRMVKEGLFYRGGPFYGIDEKTREAIDRIRFRHIVDLRSPMELERNGADYIPKGSVHHNVSALKMIDLDTIRGQNRHHSAEWMKALYRALPFDNAAYRLLFSIVRNDELPVYFHCSAGKDRTGVFAALLLELLGASREEIVKNYMLSYDAMMRFLPVLPPLPNALTDEEWILGVFEEIEKRYGDTDAYFLKEYGITEEEKKQIRDNCLI